MKTILEELGHFDAPLIVGEILFEGETLRKSPWFKETFTIWPYWYIVGKEGMLYAYFDPKGRDWKVKKAGETDPKVMKRETLLHYNDLKKIIDTEPALNKKEFAQFIKKLKDFWPWMECMYWMVEYYDKKNEPLGEAIKVRKETEHFTPGIIATITNSLQEMFPEHKDYLKVILLEEALSGNIPDKSILEKRIKGYVYTNNKLYDNFEEVAKEFNVEIEKVKQPINNELKGQVAYAGKVKGHVRIFRSRKDIPLLKEGEIMVASATMPDYTPAMKKAGAIISEHGGAVSHAAITSRELKVPCIVGVRGATQILKDGDYIEVDATNGIVKIIKKV